MEISQSQSSIEGTSDERRMQDPTEYPEKDDRRIHVFSFLGYKIFVGRNALSNERLISEHRVLHRTCIWMHVHDAKGAHVVICMNGKEAPPTDGIVFRRAMDLALWFSVNRKMNKKVVWSELRDVFKPTEGIMGVWKTYKQSNVIEL